MSVSLKVVSFKKGMRSTLFRQLLSLLALSVLLLSAVGCSERVEVKEVVVYGASSMSDVLEESKSAFELKYPGTEVILNLAGTNTLLNQIKNGAQADIFITASRAYRDALYAYEPPIESHLLAYNRMVLIVSARSKGIGGMADLGQANRMVLAMDHVPAGIYTRQILDNLQAVYGPDYKDRVMANLISEESNVRQVYTKVLLGEADTGIVYGSDVREEDLSDIKVIEIEDPYNVKAESYIIRLNGDGDQESSHLFYDFIQEACGPSFMANGFILD